MKSPTQDQKVLDLQGSEYDKTGICRVDPALSYNTTCTLGKTLQLLDKFAILVIKGLSQLQVQRTSQIVDPMRSVLQAGFLGELKSVLDNNFIHEGTLTRSAPIFAE